MAFNHVGVDLFVCFASELIITAGGENVPPVPIEDALKSEVSIISNAMVIGDKRKFLSVLLTLKVTLSAPLLPTHQPIQSDDDSFKPRVCLCLLSVQWMRTGSRRTGWAQRPWTSASAWTWEPLGWRRSSLSRSQASIMPYRRGWSASTPGPLPRLRGCRSLWCWSETFPSPEENWVSRRCHRRRLPLS